MRVVLGLLAGAAAAAAIVLLLWRDRTPLDGATAANDGTAVADPPQPIKSSIDPANPPPDPGGAGDAAPATPKKASPWPEGKAAVHRKAQGDLSLTTFTAYVNGQIVPLDIRQETGMSAADAAIVQRETAAENGHIQRALRQFAGELEGFRHSKDEIAHATALELMTWVAQHQPMQLALGEELSRMDDQAFRRFTEERRPWNEFFPDDGLVIRYARLMHQIRRDTIARIQAAGVESGPFEALRTRYLLDGHFRLAQDRPFEFGRAMP